MDSEPPAVRRSDGLAAKKGVKAAQQASQLLLQKLAGPEKCNQSDTEAEERLEALPCSMKRWNLESTCRDGGQSAGRASGVGPQLRGPSGNILHPLFCLMLDVAKPSGPSVVVRSVAEQDSFSRRYLCNSLPQVL